MNGFTLACLRCGLALALALSAGLAPAIADEDPWPGIRTAYREGDFAGASASLRRLLERNPDDREALYYTAIIQWRLEDYVAAAAAYRRVLALDPNGPFGQDARMWLETYAHLAVATPTPAPAKPTPTPRVARRPAPTPKPRPTSQVAIVPPKPAPVVRRGAPRPSILPLDQLRPSPKSAPWLAAQPKGRKGRARSANPRPGYFKAADGTFEFVPPAGFVLLDEGVQGSEMSTLFGLPKSAQVGEAPPTLLITWREFDDLKRLKADQRTAKERQLLAMEASMYGPGAVLEARFGGPCYRVHQEQSAWGADTLLFFQHGRLYALTYGGGAEQLERYRPRVEKSWDTPIFYQ